MGLDEMVRWQAYDREFGVCDLARSIHRLNADLHNGLFAGARKVPSDFMIHARPAADEGEGRGTAAERARLEALIGRGLMRKV